MPAGEWKNKLYFGDNLGILREHVPSESVDLIYLDPLIPGDHRESATSSMMRLTCEGAISLCCGLL